jgi:hypothetical protein
MAEAPRNWQSNLRGVAVTVLFVALALFFAVRLLESVAVGLIILATAAALIAGIVVVVRARRSRW